MLEVSFEKKIDNNEAIAVIISDDFKIDSQNLLINQEYDGFISKIIKDKNFSTSVYGYSKVLSLINKEGVIRHLILIPLGSALTPTHTHTHTHTHTQPSEDRECAHVAHAVAL